MEKQFFFFLFICNIVFDDVKGLAVKVSVDALSVSQLPGCLHFASNSKFIFDLSLC